eukprot:TRINITY_DN2287_c0_g1_i1.p1 TRINITY_DN2287_c0_g1~~TRINITY_DN2287_c0_g1_i1.p1  ORF type:complete len:549 (+),score=70.97 TRINITY_DN2287_c0_g1_i1:78-1649(+)
MALRLAAVCLAVAVADETCSPDGSVCGEEFMLLQMHTAKVEHQAHLKPMHSKHTFTAATLQKLAATQKAPLRLQEQLTRHARKADAKAVHMVRKQHRQRLAQSSRNRKAKALYKQVKRRVLAMHKRQTAAVAHQLKMKHKAWGCAGKTGNKTTDPCSMHSLPTPVCMENETICYDAHGLEICESMEKGCPMICMDNETVCEDKYFTPSMKWCSPPEHPCPIMCDHETEQFCWDEKAGKEFCGPKTLGCPVDCPHDSVMCTTPAPSDCPDCAATNWCNFGGSCPVECDWATEVSCWNETSQTDKCFPMETGCPFVCPAGESMCTVSMGEGYPPSHWCQDGHCPPDCAEDEVLCWNETSMKDVCVPMAEGCPVTCGAGEETCVEPPACELCQAHQWCSTEGCPLTCGFDEMYCMDSMGKENCVPMTFGCPVECGPEEHVCEEKPWCEDCAPHRWCQLKEHGECPLSCSMTEAYCWDHLTGKEFCAPGHQGCPVHCVEGEHVCREEPWCSDPWCHAWQYCSTTPCP